MRSTDGHPVRLRFTKQGKVRFISHRDVARAFDRAFRIEQLPLAFTAGFSPRPEGELRARPLGRAREQTPSTSTSSCASRSTPTRCSRPSVGRAARRHRRHRRGRARRSRPGAPGSCHLVDYRVAPVDTHDEPLPLQVLVSLVDAVSASAELPITQVRKGKERVDDVKPVIRSIELGPRRYATPVLELSLSTQPRGARPREVLDAVGNVSRRRPRRGPRRTNRPMDRARRRADGTAGSRRARAHRSRRARHERRNPCPTTRSARRRPPPQPPTLPPRRRRAPVAAEDDDSRLRAANGRPAPCRNGRPARCPTGRRLRPTAAVVAVGADRAAGRNRNEAGTAAARPMATTAPPVDEIAASRRRARRDRRPRPDRRRRRRGRQGGRGASRRVPRRASATRALHLPGRERRRSRRSAIRAPAPVRRAPRPSRRRTARRRPRRAKRRRRRGGRGRGRSRRGRSEARARPRPRRARDADVVRCRPRLRRRARARARRRRARAPARPHPQGASRGALPDVRPRARGWPHPHRGARGSQPRRAHARHARPATSRSTATSTSVASRTCSPAWRRRSSTSARRRTACSTAATSRSTRPTSRAANKPKIERMLKNGQSIIVQVTKNPIAHKGARLTQEVSLAGRFLVMVPGRARDLRDLEAAARRRAQAAPPHPRRICARRTPASSCAPPPRARPRTSSNATCAGCGRSGTRSRSSPRSRRQAKLLYQEPDLVLRLIREEFTKEYRGIVDRRPRALRVDPRLRRGHGARAGRPRRVLRHGGGGAARSSSGSTSRSSCSRRSTARCGCRRADRS